MDLPEARPFAGPGALSTTGRYPRSEQQYLTIAWLDLVAPPYLRRVLPRKEVIQPQLPLRLPCYDFVPVTRPALGRCPPRGLAHGLQASPAPVT
jgi:hypothetical protein